MTLQETFDAEALFARAALAEMQRLLDLIAKDKRKHAKFRKQFMELALHVEKAGARIAQAYHQHSP